MYYEFKPGYSLDPHQVDAIAFITSRPRGGAALWAKTGLGKGFVGVKLVMDWLNEGHERILLAPPSGLTVDWIQKLWLYAGIRAVEWDSAKPEDKVRVIGHSKMLPAKSVKTAVGTTKRRRDRVGEIIAWGPEAVIVDESHRFRSSSASQTKGLLKIVQYAKPAHRVALTATQVTTVDPEKLRPQLMFVDSELLRSEGVDSWAAWRSRFCHIEKQRFGKVVVERVVGVKNQPQLDALCRQVALVQEDDVLNLPDSVFEPVYFQMPPRALELYRLLAKTGSILKPGLEITTAHAAVKAGRLAELRSGYLTDFEGVEHPQHEALTEAVLSLLDRLEEPALIFYKFRRTGDMLQKALSGFRVGHIRGGIRASEKSAIEAKFQNGELDIVLGQHAAVCAGLTLTATNRTIIAEPDFSLEYWIQELGRTRRRGQKKTCFYYLLQEPRCLDPQVYEALQAKQDFSELLSRNLVKWESWEGQ